MDDGVYIFKKVKPNLDFINEILTFDVRNLDAKEGPVISKYATALSQYLIYFKAEVNRTRVSIHQKQRILDSEVNKILVEDKKVMKVCKTKTSAVDYIVQTSDVLKAISESIYEMRDELMIVEGVDKMISDLISTLKRELTRRENELYSVRKERYSN